MTWASILANFLKLANLIGGMVRDAGLRKQGATEQRERTNAETAARVELANRARIDSVPDDRDFRD